MGYDIFMLDKPKDFKSGYKPQFEDQPEYFRFNSGGMFGMVQLMHKAGILEEETKEPDIPDFPSGNFSGDRAEELEEWFFTDTEPGKKPTKEEKEILNPLKTQLDKARRTRSGNNSEIPLFKFCSNIGWIISPEECRVISNGLKKAVTESKPFLGIFGGFLPSKRKSGMTKKEAEDWVLNWAAFNEIAANYGGYKVI